MKQYSKNHLFTNFSESTYNYSVSKSNLSTNNIFNLTTENNVIEPVCNFLNLFEKYFDKTSYSTLIENNFDFIKTLTFATIYDYFDPTANKITTRIFVIDSNYTLYELNCADLIFNDLNLQFSSIPTAINSNNKLYLYNHDDLFIMITNDNFPIIIVTPPNLISIENFHDYTIFATHENKFSIFITELTDIINIESDLSNYIEFKLSPELGKILKIIIYKDNVYIAQQYGISKFTFDEDSATIKNFCSIQSSIFAETISLIDDYIVFLSSSGLYLFDGNDIKQIFTTITKNINGEDFKSVVFNNKYYLKSKYYINDISESVILQFDIENNYCTIYKIGEIVDIYVIKNLQNYMLVATIKDENNVYEILTYDKTTVTKFDKYLKFNKIAFDETPEKVLSEVKIQSIGKYQLIINSDTESSQFDINGSAHIKNIGLKGQIFEIEIKSKHAFVIESILLKTVPSSEG